MFTFICLIYTHVQLKSSFKNFINFVGTTDNLTHAILILILIFFSYKKAEKHLYTTINESRHFQCASLNVIKMRDRFLSIFMPKKKKKIQCVNTV